MGKSIAWSPRDRGAFPREWSATICESQWAHSRIWAHEPGLFVPILQDVQRYALKARHLRKHKGSVDGFYRKEVENERYTSEIVARFTTRFQRYRESMFLFLDEDLIPWNNNTGEKALRHIAVQRKI